MEHASLLLNLAIAFGVIMAWGVGANDVANAMGVKGIRVEKPGEIGAAIREALAAGEPTVVDVVTAFDGLSFRDVTSALTQG